jgi:RNA polymerase sigma-70 factor (ECF subfamily)
MVSLKEKVMPGTQDELVIEKIKNGDKKAFGELIDKYKAILLGISYHIVNDFEQAEDLVQEVFIKAYANIESLNAPGAFGSWIRKIAANASIDWLRKHKNERYLNKSENNWKNLKLVSDSGDEFTPEAKIFIKEKINLLPEDQKAVIVMKYVEDLSYEEIAQYLDIPAGTVKSRLYRAKETLSKEMKKALRES